MNVAPTQKLISMKAAVIVPFVGELIITEGGKDLLAENGLIFVTEKSD